MVTNISDAFKKKLRTHLQNYIQKADILFFDDSGNVTKKIELGMDELMDNGMSYASGTSNTDTFDIGAAVIGSASIAVSNENDWLSNYDFENAKIIPYVGITLDDGTKEYIKKGVYNMENPSVKGTVIVLETLDNMSLFERPLSDAGLIYPTTAKRALQAICDACGVILKTTSFTNDDIVIDNPEDVNITCLDAVSYIAQISCKYARCDADGKLELKWYDMTPISEDRLDGGRLDDYNTGDFAYGGNFTYMGSNIFDGGNFGDMSRYHHFYMLMQTPKVYTDDTVISGCKISYVVDEEDKSVSGGEEGYVLKISDNPFIQSDDSAQKVLQAVMNEAVGITFRKCNFNPIYDPTVEAGDVGYVSDYKGNSYHVIITNISGNIGGTMSISSDSETASKSRSTGKASTSAQIKQAVKKERIARETAMEALAQQLATSSGLFMTTVKQEDGSSIYYMHDKATLAESTIVWKLTANAFGVSTDGGKTYPYGLDATGTAILDRIYAIGIIADYILGGTIEGEIIAKNFKMQGGSIDVTTSSNTQDKIKILYHSDTYNTDWIAEISPLTFAMTNTGDNGDANNRIRCALQAGGLYFYEGSTDEGKSVYHKDGCRVGGKMHADGAIVSEDSLFGAVRVVAGKTTGYFSGTALSVYGSAIVNGDFTVTGSYSKNRAVATESNGTVLLSAYETSTPLFGDIGQGIIGEDGECRVYIDEIFRETVVLGSQYNVFIQKYGQGEAYVSERNSEYFVVNGTAGLSFAWEMKGVQKGLANCRLDSFERRTDTNDAFYEDRSYDYKVDVSDTDYSNVGFELITEYEKELIA